MLFVDDRIGFVDTVVALHVVLQYRWCDDVLLADEGLNYEVMAAPVVHDV